MPSAMQWSRQSARASWARARLTPRIPLRGSSAMSLTSEIGLSAPLVEPSNNLIHRRTTDIFESVDQTEVPIMAAAIQTQDFSKSQCAAGLRAALNILDKWKASCEQACRVLRISRSTYTRAKQRDSEWAIGLDFDQMQRISLVLNIHAALRLVFDNPENVYGFPSMENRNEFFNGRAPLEIMAQGDMISLYETFRRIDTLRGAQW